MQFFIDSADLEELKELMKTGLVDGVTTNPSIIAKTGRPHVEMIAAICDIVPGPVSAEVIATQADEMIKEGIKLQSIAPQVVIKVPLTVDGLKACKALSAEGIAVNVTLCFSALQALLAAKAGAIYISPFVGRLDDIGQNGMHLIQEIIEIYNRYTFKTQVLVASMRHSAHVLEAALLGVDVVTLPPKVLWQLYQHPLTDIGLKAFLDDWQRGHGQ